MNKRRLLVIGASGFLGSYVARAAARSHQVIRGNRVGCDRDGSIEIDVTSKRSVDLAFEQANPDAVVLLAALSDIDRCEVEPNLAREVNVQGAENVAQACARARARLLYTSSAAVFDG